MKIPLVHIGTASTFSFMIIELLDHYFAFSVSKSSHLVWYFVNNEKTTSHTHLLKSCTIIVYAISLIIRSKTLHVRRRETRRILGAQSTARAVIHWLLLKRCFLQYNSFHLIARSQSIINQGTQRHVYLMSFSRMFVSPTLLANMTSSILFPHSLHDWRVTLVFLSSFRLT